MTTASATAFAIELDEASVAFRLADARIYTAVERASLAVRDGEFIAIVGPTGCGKSTLLNLTAGLLAPASGAVRIFGAPLSVPLTITGPDDTLLFGFAVVDCALNRR